MLLVILCAWAGPGSGAAAGTVNPCGGVTSAYADVEADCPALRARCETEHEDFVAAAREAAGGDTFFDWEFGYGGLPLCDYLYSDERCPLPGYLACMEPAFTAFQDCMLAANRDLASDPSSADPSACAAALLTALDGCPPNPPQTTTTTPGAGTGGTTTLPTTLSTIPSTTTTVTPIAATGPDEGGSTGSDAEPAPDGGEDAQAVEFFEGDGGAILPVALLIAVILIFILLGYQSEWVSVYPLAERARHATDARTSARLFRRHLKGEAFEAGFEYEPPPQEDRPAPPQEPGPGSHPVTEPPPEPPPPPPTPEYGLAGSVELPGHPGQHFTEAHSQDMSHRLHIPSGARAQVVLKRPDGWSMVEVADHGRVWVRSSDLAEVVPPAE